MEIQKWFIETPQLHFQCLRHRRFSARRVNLVRLGFAVVLLLGTANLTDLQAQQAKPRAVSSQRNAKVVVNQTSRSTNGQSDSDLVKRIVLFPVRIGKSLGGVFVSRDRKKAAARSTLAREPSGLAVRLSGDVAALELVEEDQNKIRFSARLTLRIVNVGSKPAILLKQDDLEIGAEMLARNVDDAKANRYFYQSSHWPSVSRRTAWASWRERLDSATPQPDELSFLFPGQSLIFEAITALYIEKTASERLKASWDEIKEMPGVSLQVQVELWPVNLEPDRNPEDLRFGKMLRERWTPFGDLQLGQLTSQPIQINFSEQEKLTKANRKP